MGQLTDRLGAYLLKSAEQPEIGAPRVDRAAPRALTPVAAQPPSPVAALPPVVPPPVVAVVGFKPGCGATTVACALAHGLAKSGCRAALVATSDRLLKDSRRRTLSGNRTAAAVQSELATRSMAAADVSNIGPVCLADLPGGDAGVIIDPYVKALARFAAGRLALVWDVGAGEADSLRTLVSNTDAVAMVVDDSSDPELVKLTAATLAGSEGRHPITVVNGSARAPEALDAAIVLPRSRLSVWLLQRGSNPRGLFGMAVGELVGRCSG